ncbi:hypothetical protein P152DRAFT_384833, partial [Eremomyces bilateralis CBS 781.70]
SWKYLKGDVDTKHADILLIVCCFVTGLLDSGIFCNFGVFVGMQTGNTVLLGLSTASLPPNQPHLAPRAILSIVSFLIGAFVTANFIRLLSRHLLSRPGSRAPSRPASVHLPRLPLLLALLFQLLLLIIAGALCATRLVPTEAREVLMDPSSYNPLSHPSPLSDLRVLIPLPPLAMHFGSQVAISRALGVSEIPTSVLTSAYADLMGDPGLFETRNRKRDRRVASMVLLLGGGIVGAWLLRAGIQVDGLIWVGVGVKAVVLLGAWV